MKNLTIWWNKKENRQLFLRICIFVFLPLISSILLCLLDGKLITDIYLPFSDWNDEMIYYKQVEATVKYGEPIGYYGYNESHALVSSYATWGPAVLLPWIVWGKLFGWTFFSPIIANIVFMMISFGIFAVLIKPNWKQTISAIILCSVFLPFPRYILSCMPEVFAFGSSILIIALTISCSKQFKWFKIIFMLLSIFMLTLMRPYLLALIIFPTFLVWKKRKLAVFFVAISALLSVATYVWYTNQFCAQYFVNTVETSWLQVLANDGIVEAIKSIYAIIRTDAYVFLKTLREGLLTRVPRGAYCLIFTICFILLCTILPRWKKLKKEQNLHLILATLLSFIAMLFAVLLLYPQMQPAAKHFLVFVALGIFVLALFPSKYYWREIIFAICCLYLFSIPNENYPDFNYSIPYFQKEHNEEYLYWEEVFDSELEYTPSDNKFDHTILWVLSDYDETQAYITPFAYLYMLPEGYGINCCQSSYILDNIENLNARYLFVSPNGKIDQTYQTLSFDVIGKTENAVLYKIK